MSETTVAELNVDNPAGGSRSQKHAVMAVLLAILLLATVTIAAYQIREMISLPFLVLLGAGAFAGLLAAGGALAGFVHFGRMPQQKAFLDGLVDALDDACVVTDNRGRVIFSNAAYRAYISHAKSGRLVGVENLYAGIPEAGEAIYRLSLAARDAKPATEEFRLGAKSGSLGSDPQRPAWFRIAIAPISIPGGRFTLWRIKETTEERDRQEKAFSNLQYIINYLDNAPAGFFSTTGDGRIAYLNATLADRLGLEISDTTNGNLRLTDVVSESAADLLMSVKPVPGEVKTEVFDLDLKTVSGEPVAVRIVHRTDYDEQGRAQPSRSLVLDKTEAADAGEGAAEVQLARFINNAPIGIAEITSDGVIKNANSAFTVMSGGKVRGARIVDLVAEHQREKLAESLGAADVAETGDPIDVQFDAGDGVTGQLYFNRSIDKTSGISETIVYAIDTTKHSSLEVQLAQSQKMQAVGQLAGGVAHDFNNVLTAIIGFSDLLLAKHRPTDPSFADIMNIKQNANRAANLVRQLLAFSRRQTLRPQVLSLNDALSDLGNLLGRLLGEKVELNVTHGRDAGLVKVDVNQFEQVVINLAVNARDAMPQGGTLTVRTANVTPAESKTIKPGVMPEGNYVLLEIADTGMGMPPEVVAKMYEPFFSTKEVGKGTGLGLSTVYGIIKQTGGFIFCDSEPGRGTNFRIYLPRHFEAPKAEGAASGAAAANQSREDLTGNATILLVEDEDAVRAFASRALETRGYTVLQADSGERALEVFDGHDGKIDLILSDVVMPEMDGPTLLKELRKRGIDTKVVFISGYAEDAFEKNLEGHDDFAFLPKPFSLKQLAEAVKKATES